MTIRLTEAERSRLRGMVRRPRSRKQLYRAEALLALDEGQPIETVARRSRVGIPISPDVLAVVPAMMTVVVMTVVTTAATTVFTTTATAVFPSAPENHIVSASSLLRFLPTN